MTMINWLLMFMDKAQLTNNYQGVTVAIGMVVCLWCGWMLNDKYRRSR
jgi:hypothetical protein